MRDSRGREPFEPFAVFMPLRSSVYSAQLCHSRSSDGEQILRGLAMSGGENWASAARGRTFFVDTPENIREPPSGGAVGAAAVAVAARGGGEGKRER